MIYPSASYVRLVGAAPRHDDVGGEVLRGLRGDPPTLPCKLLYDARGSALFEQICELPEYYLTRTELSIMRLHAGEMARRLGERCLLIELGSGRSIKTHLLLARMSLPAGYVPIDISGEALSESALMVAELFPHLQVMPLCADYTQPLVIPTGSPETSRRAIYFPGSTLGNFHPDQAVQFLQRMRELVGSGGQLLLGLDMKKDSQLLEAAYNDARGVTAQFNLNVLVRLNRQWRCNFDLSQWQHEARYVKEHGRMEMHLVCTGEQRVQLLGEEFTFRAGQSIRTECSYKFDVAQVVDMAEKSGWKVAQMWTDAQKLFSVHLLQSD